jgi:multiple sugar transport system ATP-binding protein
VVDVAGVVFERVSKVFPDGTVAVADLDLTVPDGEFMVLVGPSGSGKSTALRMLAGLEETSAGTIRIGSKVVNDLAPRDRDIAMVFQNYALYPHMNVGDNVGFGLKLRGVGRRERRERVAESAGMLGIGDLLRRRPRQLSGGQRQRVAMGRAIVREPQAFLMDEPLSNLDAKLRVEMRAYIALLHTRLATTTIYVTHDQIEAMTMGDRVAVMREGRLEQLDSPQELYERPVNLFVASFIGSPAMNLVRSRIEAEDGQVFVSLGRNRVPLPRSLLDDRPSLRRAMGGDVVLGIRPEAFEDALFSSSTPADHILDVDVALAESLGSEVIVHFELEARPVRPAEVGAVANGGSNGAAVAELVADDGRAPMTARVDPRTTAETGGTLRLALDVVRLHFFDPVTQRALR